MTTPLYLTQVTLTDFRSFGKKQPIAIPGGPGVLLVAGPNGLGKTSLVEAVEWVLTDTVRRFKGRHNEAALHKSLARRTSEAESLSPDVSLDFSDGSNITRGFLGDPDPGRILSLLVDPSWTNPLTGLDALSAYLGQTHFFSQSPSLRMTERDPKTRWLELSDMTGAAQVDGILKRLGPGTARRFSDAISAAEKEHEALSQDVARAERLLEAIRDRETIKAAGAMLPPDRIAADAGALITRLSSETRRKVDVPEGAAERVEALATAIADARAWLEERQTDLPRWREWATRWVEIRGELDRAAREKAAVGAYSAVATALHQATETRDQWKARQQALASIAGLKQQQDTADAGERDAEQALETAQTKAQDLAALRSRIVDGYDAVDRAVMTRDRWVALAHQEQRVARTVADAAAQAENRAAAQARLQVAYNRRDSLQQQLEEADAALAKAQGTQAKAARDVNEKAALLAELVHTIHEEDKACPLCAAEYDRGELLARSRSALSRQDPSLRAAEKAVEDAASQKEAREKAVIDHAAEVKAAENAVRPFEVLNADAEEAKEALMSDPLLAGRAYDGLRDWLGDKALQAEAEVAKAREHLKALDPEDTAAARLEQAQHEVKQAAERSEQARAEAAAAKLAVTQARQKAIDAVPGSPSPDPAETDRQLLAAEQRVTAAAKTFNAAAQGLADAPADGPAEDAITWATARQTALAQHREDLEGEQSRLRDKWGAVGLEAEPSMGVLAEETKRLEQLAHSLEAIEPKRAALADGLEAWSADQRQHEFAADLRDLLRRHKLPEAASLSDLQQLKDQKAAELKAWKRARDLARKVRDVVSTHQDGFIDRSIKPLEAKAQAIFETWSAFPDIKPRLPFNRSNNSPKVQAMVGDNPADLVLSEGQAGATALSFLLAASTSYRWSRWRALLLDDPLQYTDLVHKAAFLDLLRPLILEERYQVIMTSHDLEEADFIRRKCRNAGIPFTLCRLLAVGNDGVDYRISGDGGSMP